MQHPIGKVILGATVASLCIALPVQAETGVSGPIKTINKDIRTTRASTTETVKEIRKDVRENILDLKKGSTTGSTTRAMLKQEIEQRNRAIKETRENARAEIKDEREKRRLAIINAYGDRIIKRLTAAIDRLEKVGDRIQSRIEKVRAAGGNTAAAEAALTSARAELGLATNGLTAVEVALSQLPAATAASTTPQTQFDGIRNAVKDVRDHLQAGLQFLRTAISSLKGMSTATTTSN